MIKKIWFSFLSMVCLSASIIFLIPIGVFLWKLFEHGVTIYGFVLGLAPCVIILAIPVFGFLFFGCLSVIFFNESIPKRIRFIDGEFVFMGIYFSDSGVSND